MEDHQFAWILWYIWKGINNKVFSNMDVDPLDTLKLADTESKLWAESQILTDEKRVQQVGAMVLPSIPGIRCFTDGSWKDNDIFSGQGWYSTLEGFTAFASYLEDIKSLKESFSCAEIIYVPRTQNKQADNLARSARKETSFVVHMDQDLPVWFTESI
uniref:Uncharacterized protein n=1 Tax=Brassica oleracea TaxID=3712 RepID=A0A3P6GD14_BRAOL|nr:unnamed protein product [Brassica oleracea]